mgnify:CR=1 FL=1
MNYDFSGFENAESAKQLRQGLTGKLIGIGNSMTPYLKSRQAVICIPVTDETELKKKDIVLSKVNGHFYLHFIYAIKNDSQFLIGNAHGHMNGWVGRNNIYGKVVEKL